MKRLLTLAALVLVILAPLTWANDNKDGIVNLAVAPEASLAAISATALTTGGTQFADYTGTLVFTYKLRAGAAGGTITAKVTSDFNAGGPSVASPAAGDSFTYTCLGSVTTGTITPCSGSQTLLTTGTTPVAGFAANSRSQKAGDTVTLNFTLTNDPAYAVDNYAATITYTISAN